MVVAAAVEDVAAGSNVAIGPSTSRRGKSGPKRGADAGFRRTVLANGLTILSESMPSVRSVALGVWVRRSSVHERPEEMGISHFLEHMVFKGTERRSAREIAMSLENLGGSLDAFTAREHTSFQARVLDEHLPQAADVLCDLITRPTLRESDLRLERNVVLEEIAMVEDTPDDLVFELHNETLWGAHPYGYQILGTRETIGALEVDAVRQLHATAYRAPNMVVAAAGRLSHDDLVSTLCDAGWDRLDGTPAPSPEVPAPLGTEPVRRHVEREGQQVQVVLGSPSVPYADDRRYAMSLASLLLGGGMSSRLFQRVREELGLAYSVFTFQSFHRDAGIHGVYAGTSPDTAERALDEILNQLGEVARGGFPADELAAGKSQLKGQLTLSLESPSARMFRVAAAALYDEPFVPLDESLRRIDAVTLDEVAAAGAEFLAPARQTVITLGRAERGARPTT